MMNSEEIYYRRTYSLLNNVIEAYKDGFDKEKTKKLWSQYYSSDKDKMNITLIQQSCLRLTIAIALMGINKEKLENIGRIENYNDSFVYLDARSESNPSIKKRMQEFDNYKTKNSIFDNWLSLINSPDIDIDSLEIFKRVRNGLLHSNFTIDNKDNTILFTKVKTKSYYESVLLNINFEQFVLSYFSDIPTMGIPEKTYSFIVNKNTKITDKQSLKEYLKQLILIEFKHNKGRYDEKLTLDYVIHSSSNKSEVDLNKVATIMKEKNISLEDIQFWPINPKKIDEIINFFENKYKNTLYMMPSETIKALINAHIEYQFDPTRIISNWLVHFYYLSTALADSNFDVNTSFFKNDEYQFTACYPSLLILKSYLIIYRMQNNSFTELNYYDIDFELDDEEYTLFSENISDPNTNDNYYIDSVNKLKVKDPSLDDEIVKKMVICDIIRNSLAHGNVISKLTEKFIPYIELKDFDKKTGKTRGLLLTIEKLEKFLNSKAFEPKYCFKKEIDEKKLICRP